MKNYFFLTLPKAIWQDSSCLASVKLIFSVASERRVPRNTPE